MRVPLGKFEKFGSKILLPGFEGISKYSKFSAREGITFSDRTPISQVMEVVVFFLAKISRNSTELPSDAFPLQSISQSRQSFNHKRCLLACIIIARKKASFSAIATWGKNSCHFFWWVIAQQVIQFSFFGFSLFDFIFYLRLFCWCCVGVSHNLSGAWFLVQIFGVPARFVSSLEVWHKK